MYVHIKIVCAHIKVKLFSMWILWVPWKLAKCIHLPSLLSFKILENNSQEKTNPHPKFLVDILKGIANISNAHGHYTLCEGCTFCIWRSVYQGDSDYKCLYLLHFLRFTVCLFLGLNKAVYLLFTMGKVLIRGNSWRYL